MWGRDRRAQPLHLVWGAGRTPTSRVGALKTRPIRVSRRDTTSKNNVSPYFFTITYGELVEPKKEEGNPMVDFPLLFGGRFRI